MLQRHMFEHLPISTCDVLQRQVASARVDAFPKSHVCAVCVAGQSSSLAEGLTNLLLLSRLPLLYFHDILL